MKNLFLFLFVSFLFISCGKEELKEVEVFKACPEIIFLKVGNDYYQVCNTEELESIESGATINIAYKEIDDCDNSFEICLTRPPLFIPESKSWVKVLYQF